MFDWGESGEKYPLLSEGEIIAAYKNAHKGNREAIEALYKHTFYWIKNIAVGYLKRGLTLDELISAGVGGLLKGITNGNFNPQRGAWSTYITLYVKGEILRQLKKESVIPLPYNCKPGIKYPSCYLESQISKEYDSKIFDNLAWEEEVVGVTKNSEQAKILKKAILKLHQKERQAIHLYYYCNLTLEEVGMAMSLTKQRIKQILDKAKQILSHLIAEQNR